MVDIVESSQAASPAAGQRYLLLGTAGHIDHGKTSLIKALTGIDTDRLPEEKQRGMTIELGFAHLQVQQGSESVQFGIVDVPGHEKFVRTMVAGATAIDMVLLLVAADDSVMPQTREHVDIIKLLGVQRGVVAISKCDLVDAEMVELVCDEVRELLADSPLADAPVVPVSSVTGSGIDTLREALHGQAQSIPDRRASDFFRLAIDRVFTIHGRGTVVTGSVTSGQVAVGDTLELLPVQKRCKVRGLQTHFDQADSLHLGQRVAVNLTGVERDEVRRGDELASSGYLRPSRTIDVQLITLSSNAKPLKHLQRVRLCVGTRESLARVRLLGGASGGPDRRDNKTASETQAATDGALRKLAPGEKCFAQLQMADAVAAEWGRRFIIRDETDSGTLGGGVVLRPVSQRLKKSDIVDVAGLEVLLNGESADRLEEAIRFENSRQLSSVGRQLDLLKLAAATGMQPNEIDETIRTLQQQKRLVALGEPEQLVAVAMIESCRARAIEKLRRFHEKHTDDPGQPRDAFVGWLKARWGEAVGAHVFEILRGGSKPCVRVLGQYCCLAEFAPEMSAEDERLLRALVAEYEAAAYQPPAATALKCAASVSKSRLNKLIKIATATGELVQISPDFVLHAGRLEALKEKMAQAIAERGGLTVADVRTMIDSSRKYVVPLVEYLDRSGFTKRVGDERVLAEVQTGGGC